MINRKMCSGWNGKCFIWLQILGWYIIVFLGVAEPLTFLRASYLGTAGNDNLEGVAEGPDGTIYLVGNLEQPWKPISGQKSPIRIGEEFSEGKCGYTLILRLSSDGSQIIGGIEIAKGILHGTGIAVTKQSVYVGGYGSPGIETLFRSSKVKGWNINYPLSLSKTSGNSGEKDPLANRPWLGRMGAPCVLKFDLDLTKLQSGTYLEGWQQVYDKHRRCGKFPHVYTEYFWQPINICPLPSGDIAVSHDGGYFRDPKPDDQQWIQAMENQDDQRRLQNRLGFYDVCDYVSCLNEDLTIRRWRTDIYTPSVNPEVAKVIKKGWGLSHYGNPRIHRMRMDSQGNLWVCGWSATETSQEPWWSPFLWQLDGKTGRPLRKLYNHDPMSGGGNRMGGQVADTAILSVTVTLEGDLLTCLIADGGNSVMEWGPRGQEGKRMLTPVKGPGLGKSPTHFWGQVHRVDGQTFDGLGGVKSGPWAWPIDTVGISGRHFIVLGRWNEVPLPWSKNAWWTHESSDLPNPNAFLQLVDPQFNTVFWTSWPGLRPFEIVSLSSNRVILVGVAVEGKAPTKDSLLTSPPGGEDGYFAIIAWNASLLSP